MAEDGPRDGTKPRSIRCADVLACAVEVAVPKDLQYRNVGQMTVVEQKREASFRYSDKATRVRTNVLDGGERVRYLSPDISHHFAIEET